MFTIRNLATLALGVMTAITVSVLTVILQIKYDTNFINFYAWFIVPIGAIIIGLLCTSGFIIGTRLFHVKLSKSFIIQIIMVAISSYILLYVLDYQLFNVNGLYIKEHMSFLEYYIYVSTSGSYSIKSSQVFELGQWGYAFSALEFIGFIVAGLISLGLLPSSPFCEDCEKYMKNIHNFEKHFQEPEKADEYLSQFFDLDMSSHAFKDILISSGDTEIQKKPDNGIIKIENKVYECKHCENQAIGNRVSLYNGKDWDEQQEYDAIIDSPTRIYFDETSA